MAEMKTEKPAIEPLLTRKEVAAILRVNVKSLERGLIAGLPSVRVGGRVRYAAGDLEQWIQAQKEA